MAAPHDTPEDNPHRVPSLERGIRILMMFGRGRGELGAPAISQALGIPRTTVFRLLRTLESLELVVRLDNGNYRPGPGILRLGFDYVASLGLPDLGRPVVERLRDATHWAAQLVVREGREVVVVVRVPGASAFESSVRIGTRMPAHATVLGRILLGDLSEAELRKLFPERRLERFSPHTPSTVAELKQFIDEDRARGYAVSRSFYEPGISAIAAPVRDRTGRVVAAMSITRQREAIPPEEQAQVLVELLRAAAELSRQLDYRDAA